MRIWRGGLSWKLKFYYIIDKLIKPVYMKIELYMLCYIKYRRRNSKGRVVC